MSHHHDDDDNLMTIFRYDDYDNDDDDDDGIVGQASRPDGCRSSAASSPTTPGRMIFWHFCH